MDRTNCIEGSKHKGGSELMSINSCGGVELSGEIPLQLQGSQGDAEDPRLPECHSNSQLGCRRSTAQTPLVISNTHVMLILNSFALRSLNA